MKTLAIALIVSWFILIMSIVFCIIYKLCIQDSDEFRDGMENHLEE